MIKTLCSYEALVPVGEAAKSVGNHSSAFLGALEEMGWVLWEHIVGASDSDVGLGKVGSPPHKTAVL